MRRERNEDSSALISLVEKVTKWKLLKMIMDI